MKKADVIVVLGRGILPDGTLPPDPRKRIEKAVALYQKDLAPFIIMSGKWYFRAGRTFSDTESRAMRDYAVLLGIPKDKIICEEKSMDTIGNAYFVKTLILEPRNWTKVVVVSSEDHMARTQYVFNKVLGTNYHIQYVASELVLTGKTKTEMLEKERLALIGARRIFENTADGDTGGVKRVLDYYIPGYAKDVASASLHLDELIAWTKSKSV